MKRLRTPLFVVPITLYLLVLFTAPGVAGMVGSALSDGTSATSVERDSRVRSVQKALENKIVIEKLRAHGLDEGEIRAKLSGLSDEQLHLLAQASDRALAGGDVIVISVGGLIIIVAIVIVILALFLDKKK
ncbi:MAG TPA: PA2779 family protein [Spirochaetota bacterium]|nr:PA2779 family protein [Spirochaetota bacterium]HNT12308.1 PA2779 family protein [Spirochaetota bacterium]